MLDSMYQVFDGQSSLGADAVIDDAAEEDM